MKTSYVIAGGAAVAVILVIVASQKKQQAMVAYNSVTLGQRLKSMLPAWLK